MFSRGILLLITALGFMLEGGGAARAQTASSYAIEFHARMGSKVGHSYMKLVRTSGRGGRTVVDHFGYYAAGGDSEHLLTVFGAPGRIGPLPLDRQAKPVITYSVALTETQYQAVRRVVAKWRHRPPEFNIFERNCNTFVGVVARAMGLQAPERSFQYPPEFVSSLRQLNVHREVKRQRPARTAIR